MSYNLFDHALEIIPLLKGLKSTYRQSFLAFPLVTRVHSADNDIITECVEYSVQAEQAGNPSMAERILGLVADSGSVNAYKLLALNFARQGSRDKLKQLHSVLSSAHVTSMQSSAPQESGRGPIDQSKFVAALLDDSTKLAADLKAGSFWMESAEYALATGSGLDDANTSAMIAGLTCHQQRFFRCVVPVNDEYC